MDSHGPAEDSAGALTPLEALPDELVALLFRLPTDAPFTGHAGFKEY